MREIHKASAECHAKIREAFELERKLRAAIQAVHSDPSLWPEWPRPCPEHIALEHVLSQYFGMLLYFAEE